MDRRFFAIHQSDIDLNQVLGAVLDAIMVVGADFNVRWVNVGFAHLTEIPLSQATVKKCYDVFKGDICRTS